MSLAQKFNAWVGLAEESAFGTPVTAAQFYEVETEKMNWERKNIVLPLLGHVSGRRTVASKTNVTGTIRLPFLWENAEKWLKHAFGSIGTAGPSGGFYTHTFSLAAALPTGLTIEVNRDDAAITGNGSYQYSGCKISKLTLSQEMEQPLMLDVELLGKDRAMIAATSRTFPTYDAVDYGHMTVLQIDPGGGAQYDLLAKSLKISIDNNLFEDQYRLGGPSRAGIPRAGQRKVSIEAEIEYADLTVFNLFNGLSTDNLRFKWVSGSKSLQIDLPKCTFDGEEPSSDDQGPYYLSMKNTALANAADNDEMTAVLINTVASP